MKTIVAVAEMTSSNNKEENLKYIEELIPKAKARGAKFLCLPENFLFMGATRETVLAAENLTGPSITRLRELAKKYGIWLSLGGFQEHIENSNKIHNTHVVLDDKGEIIAFYRKMHLFSVKLPDRSIYQEDESVVPGAEVKCFDNPYFRGGLSICYDVRFAHLFWSLREQGANVLIVPAAFTEVSGKDHWEVLLRARAIETQSYVLAPAQVGEHVHGRRTHGRSMIVDPWGVVLAQCGARDSLAFAEIDTSYVNVLRENMPLIRQRVSLD